MKTLVIGDLHGRKVWRSIVEFEKDFDRVVFIGDYFDSFDVPGLDQLENFLDLIEFKKASELAGKQVVLLVGNHDHHYFPEIGDSQTSGFQRNMWAAFSQAIEQNRSHLQMAISFDGFLLTHAGVSPQFMNRAFGLGRWEISEVADKLNDLLRHQPGRFKFAGLDPYGDDQGQSPIWIRPKSLMLSNSGRKKKKMSREYVQIIGHTTVECVCRPKNPPYGNPQHYWMVDCLEFSPEYLIIDDTNVKIGKLTTHG